MRQLFTGTRTYACNIRYELISRISGILYGFALLLINAKYRVIVMGIFRDSDGKTPTICHE